METVFTLMRQEAVAYRPRTGSFQVKIGCTVWTEEKMECFSQAIREKNLTTIFDSKET